MKLIYRINTFILIIFCFFSCETNNNKSIVNEKGISNIERTDYEMQKAIQESRKTFPEFLSAYNSGDTTIQTFAIKLPFNAGERKEHIWLNSITIRDGKIYGVVNNDPEFTNEVAFGDTVEIDRNLISDWNYVRENKLYGGYSIRLLRNRMTPEERGEFDKSTGLIIRGYVE